MPSIRPADTFWGVCSANKCASFVTWGTAWQNSAGYHNTVNVSLQNKGSGSINIPYNVTLTAPGYTKLDQVSMRTLLL